MDPASGSGGVTVMGDGRRIIVGVSGSLANLEVLRAAVRITRRDRGRLCAVTAWTAPGGEPLAPQPVPAALLGEWVRAAHDRQREAFDQALGGVPGDIEVAAYVVRGRPAPVLLGFADRPDDLLVVGSGRTGLFHRGVHAVGPYCAARCACPVLLVPPPPMVRESRRLLHRVRAVSPSALAPARSAGS